MTIISLRGCRVVSAVRLYAIDNGQRNTENGYFNTVDIF